MNWSLVVFLLCSASATIAFKFPKDIERCKVGETTCITKQSNEVIHTFLTGHPAINLVSLDPLAISQIKLKQGSKSPVNIELNFNDVNLEGLSKHTFYKINGFKESPVGKYEFRLKGPVLYLVGPYTISGRVLILPIQGVGQSNMTLENPDILITFTGQSVIRNGKEYLHTDDLKLTFTITRLRMTLQNLYNGDKALGDSTNGFLNENWEEIYSELKQLIFDAFTLIIQNTVNNVFKKIPYKELFVE